MKILGIFLGLILGYVIALTINSAIADSTTKPNQFQSEQYIFNKVYDSSTNTLTVRSN
jgi:hypothetical protein